jgi:hypothetical protein
VKTEIKTICVHNLVSGRAVCGLAGQPAEWPPFRWSEDWEEVTCPECLVVRPTYTLSADGLAITCRRCGLTSHHFTDVRERFCGKCKVWHDDIHPIARQWWVEYPEANAASCPRTLDHPELFPFP